MRIAILIRLTLISVLLFVFSSCGSTRITAEPRPSIITEPQPEFKKAVFQAPSNDYILTSKAEISSASVENIFDFRQKQPIISWQKPFGPYFDTSSVCGPTRGREIYVGIRFRLTNE